MSHSEFFLDIFILLEISSNLIIVNFLDVTLNLSKISFKPFWKSNYLASRVKQIPNTNNIRIYRLLSSKNIFNNNKESYNEALCNSG